MTSSRYSKYISHCNPLRKVSINVSKLAATFVRPNGIIRNWYNPERVEKVIFLSSMATCQQPDPEWQSIDFQTAYQSSYLYLTNHFVLKGQNSGERRLGMPQSKQRPDIPEKRNDAKFAQSWSNYPIIGLNWLILSKILK